MKENERIAKRKKNKRKGRKKKIWRQNILMMTTIWVMNQLLELSKSRNPPSGIERDVEILNVALGSIRYAVRLRLAAAITRTALTDARFITGENENKEIVKNKVKRA